MKCKNCGKLKEEHHYNKGINGEYWCYPFTSPPKEKNYLWQYEEATHITGNKNKEANPKSI